MTIEGGVVDPFVLTGLGWQKAKLIEGYLSLHCLPDNVTAMWQGDD